MGFPADSHIRKFVRGKVLSDILPGDGGSFVLMFEDGEMLRLQAFAKQPVRPQVEIVATPIRADGDVKQIGDDMMNESNANEPTESARAQAIVMTRFSDKMPDCRWFVFVDPLDSQRWVVGWKDTYHIREEGHFSYRHDDPRLTWWYPLPDVPSA